MPKLSKSGTAEPPPKKQFYCIVRYFNDGAPPEIQERHLTKQEARNKVAFRKCQWDGWFEGYHEDVTG